MNAPRALIVEDEPLLRAELADQLTALWPELEIAGLAENGIEAIAMLDTLRPDIVFLDIQIPGLNGMEVARHVSPSAQIVFVTAYAEHALVAFEAGAADYLVKPLDTAQFVQIHRAAIVNLQAVDRIERQGTAMEIHFKGRRETLAVSEAYARQFRQM